MKKMLPREICIKGDFSLAEKMNAALDG